MKRTDEIHIIAHPVGNPFSFKRVTVALDWSGYIDEPSFNVFKSCPGGDYPDVPILFISAVGVRRSVRRFFRGYTWDEPKLDKFLGQF